MANKILIKRGLKANMPILSEGELGYPTDTRELFIGTGGGNVNVGGSHWYCGTAMSGTSTTTGAYSYSACPQVKLGDLYLNASYGYVYQCTTAGSGTSAKWTYKGNIKGNKGDTGAKGEKGANAATIVVAASDSKNTASADYICTGTADQNQINAAIAALPSGGGKIVLLDGTYNISGPITVNKANVTIEGMGSGTVLKRMFDDSSFFTQGVINISGSQCAVKDLKFEGNKTECTGESNKEILVGGSDNIIQNITIRNARRGIMLHHTTKNIINSVNISDVSHLGIFLCSTKYNIVANCVIDNSENTGIWMESTDSKGEYVNCEGNGIYSNQIYSCANDGIYMASNCIRNSIISNTIRPKDLVVTDTYHSIRVAGTYNMIKNNFTVLKAYTDESGGSTNRYGDVNANSNMD